MVISRLSRTPTRIQPSLGTLSRRAASASAATASSSATAEGVLTVVAALDHKLVSSHPRQQRPVFNQHDAYAGLVEREAVAGMTGVLERRPGPRVGSHPEE